ncbi:MAG: hypothetical protein ACE5Z5_11685 [Candidatus Bathyarchaeia archaeon]
MWSSSPSSTDCLGARARRLKAEALGLEEEIVRLHSTPRGDEEAVRGLFGTINTSLLGLSRILNPVLYTATGHDQDPAVAMKLLPTLQPVVELSKMDPRSNGFRFLETKLVREANRVSDALEEARECVKAVLDTL